MKINVFGNGKMNKIVLYGVPLDCKELKNVIDEYCEDVEVIAFTCDSYYGIKIDRDGEEVDTISLGTAQRMLKQGEIDGLVTVANRSNYIIIRKYIEKEIWHHPRFYACPLNVLPTEPKTEELIRSIFSNFTGAEINTLQFLVTENCNLKCKLCSHFAPLVKEPAVYDFKQFKKDLYRCSELLPNTSAIGLWGGEALLCPNLEDYIEESYKAFPYSTISVGTNCLILKNASRKLLDYMKRDNFKLNLTIYPPMEDKIEEIIGLLQKEGIRYRLSRTNVVTEFGRRYELSGNNDIDERYDECFEKFCTTVINGKFSPCYFPLLSHRFNEYFGKKYFETEDEIFDLYDESLTKEKVGKIMLTPLRSCRYCGTMDMEKWERCPQNSKLSDWVKDA
ncbi:MAG: hypothetical protein IJS47_02360 [Clostridia bacterium]|nr:hypothetical protein [Clostridia bacterium]